MTDNQNNIALAIVIALVVILLYGGFGMMGFGGTGGMMSGFYGGFGFMWLFGGLIMILVIVALVLFIFWLIKQLRREKR